jgi:mannose-6-phosphate isomerase-like protein (cupin superfamily)
MARVFRQAEGKRLGLPGRAALEIVSGAVGAQAVTLRLVEIAPPKSADASRRPHVHHGFEECIYVMSGQGTTVCDSGEYPLAAGDTVLMPADERHVTRNTGTSPLVLLCFFPVADIVPGTEEFSSFARPA